MTHSITIQRTTETSQAPKNALLRKWAKTVLNNKNIQATGMTIRIVDEKEMAELNKTYRFKQGSTNVLSFPFENPKGIDELEDYLGDIIVCAEVIHREAKQQAKSSDAHWAHMIVHGIYHLLGYDHQNDADAAMMETMEINALHDLGFDNPYKTGENIESHE